MGKSKKKKKIDRDREGERSFEDNLPFMKVNFGHNVYHRNNHHNYYHNDASLDEFNWNEKVQISP